MRRSFNEWIRDFRYYHISFFDLFEIVKKEKKRICLIFLLFYAFGFITTLKKPILYTANGIFKNRNGFSDGGLAKTLDFMWNKETSSDENAFEFFDTYGVLSKVVKNLNLQGCIAPKNGGLFKRIWNNLVLERKLSHYKTSERPFSFVTTGDILIPKRPLVFNVPHLNFKDLNYTQDFYTILRVKFQDDDQFLVTDENGKSLGVGSFDAPFYFLDDYFVLTKNTEKSLKGKTFALSFIPLNACVKGLSKNISIKKHKTKLSFIDISYTSHDRELASLIVNHLMECYQLYVMEKAREKIAQQVVYLTERKRETLNELEGVMNQHKEYLKESVAQGGFLDLTTEASFMMGKQGSLLEHQANIKANINKIASKLFDEVPETLEGVLKAIEEEDFTEIPQPLTMEVAEKIFTKYMEELDELEFEKKHYQICVQKLSEPDCDLFSIINTLQNPNLEQLLKEIQSTYSRFQDAKHWTEKEKEFFKEELQDKKEILKKELGLLTTGKDLQKLVLLKKLEDLQKSFLLMLFDDLEKNKDYLQEITEKGSHFPDKWFKEKQIDLSTKMAMSLFEQITKAIEIKNVSYNLATVDSYPVEYAVPPTLPNSPRIFHKAFVLGFGSIFIYLFILLIQYLYLGPSARFQNLKSSNLNVFGKLPATLDSHFMGLEKHVQLSLKNLSFALMEAKKKKNIVLCSTQSSLSFLSPFLELFKERKEKIVWVDVCASSHEDGFVNYLKNDGEELNFEQKNGVDYLSFGQKTPFKEEYLSSENFKKMLLQLHKSYDWIFLASKADPLGLETEILTKHSDFVIYFVTNEKLYDLWKLPKETFYLTLKKEKTKISDKLRSQLNSEKEIYIKDAAPLLDTLQKRVLSSSFLNSLSSRWQKK